MRVLHVTPYMHPRAGGPVVTVDRLCNRLSAAGLETCVLTTDAYANGAPVRTWGLDDRSYTLRVHPHRPSRLAPRRAGSRALARDLERIVPTCDVVHVHTLWTHATAAACRAARRYDVPLVVMPQGMLDPHSLARKALRKKVYGSLCEFPRIRSAAAMAYTTAEERRLAESAVSALPPGHLVPLGTDEPPAVERDEAARAFLAAHPELADRQLVIHLGRIHPKKGLDLLIPAFARVSERVPDAHLLLVGPDEGGYLKVVKRFVHALGIGPKVTHIPMLHGVAKWQALAAASVFALPSYQENFGIAVAEAARMGLPLVISNRVNLWPDVRATGAGIVVDCRVDPVADALTTLLLDEDRRRRTGQAAQALARSRYTWDRCAESVLELYASVAKPGRQPGPRVNRSAVLVGASA